MSSKCLTRCVIARAAWQSRVEGLGPGEGRFWSGMLAMVLSGLGGVCVCVCGEREARSFIGSAKFLKVRAVREALALTTTSKGVRLPVLRFTPKSVKFKEQNLLLLNTNYL